MQGQASNLPKSEELPVALDESEMVEDGLYLLEGERVPSPKAIQRSAREERRSRAKAKKWHAQEGRVLPNEEFNIALTGVRVAITDVGWLQQSASKNLQITTAKLARRFMEAVNSLVWLSCLDELDAEHITLTDMCKLEGMDPQGFVRNAKDVADKAGRSIRGWLLKQCDNAARFKDCNRDLRRSESVDSESDDVEAIHQGDCGGA